MPCRRRTLALPDGLVFASSVCMMTPTPLVVREEMTHRLVLEDSVDGLGEMLADGDVVDNSTLLRFLAEDGIGNDHTFQGRLGQHPQRIAGEEAVGRVGADL